MFASDFTKAPEEVVIDLINFDNGTSFTPETLVVKNPTAIPNTVPIFRNTEIIAAVAASFTQAHGSTRLYYNRIDLANVPGIRSTAFDLTLDARMISDLVPFINARYHINLTPADYINVPLPALTGEPQTVRLQAAPDSLVYNGFVDLTIEVGGDVGTPIDTVLPNKYLDIFQFIPATA